MILWAFEREMNTAAPPTIDEVRRFWNSQPLGLGYVRGEIGSKEWLAHFDHLKANYGLIGVLDTFTPDELRGKHVLDVGCGPSGFWARRLDRIGAVYSGIDISDKSVALGREAVRPLGLAEAIRVGNAEALPFHDNAFDAVVSEGVIHHTPNTQACIDEIYRVLKPGGRAAVSVYYRVALLRYPTLFGITKWVMRTAGAVTPGRGREGMPDVKTADDFVRMYDGAGNPIGKAYTKQELRQAFGRFQSIEFHRYFMPPVPQLLCLPEFARRIFARFGGLMILVVARK